MDLDDTACGRDGIATPLDPTARFSDRVADYVRHRPDYPAALMPWLHAELGIDAGRRVADIGAGTGISTRMWLDGGHEVVGVEPNAAMRQAAREAFADRPGIEWMDGTAERTGLAPASIDIVSAAQAFHWFDPVATHSEWARVLRPGGLAVVFWNTRLATGNAFLEGYERLLRDFGSEYQRIEARRPDDEAMARWFGPGLRSATRFAHHQVLDYDGLRGRALSSSYTPGPGHPRHDAMLEALRGLFDAHALEGRVTIDYATRVFAGALC